MAQIRKKTILTLCIPIYNRLAYLESQLERMMEDKDLFESQIQLVISDNCSTDDLRTCCEKYQRQGLNMIYHRHEVNLGPDGNFNWCYNHSSGKYVWLLGSDDIPRRGVLQKIVEVLEKGEYGLLHLSTIERNQELTELHSSDEMVVAVNYWITFLSANIILTKSLKSVDLSDYMRSFMIQVPAYLNACCSYTENAILYMPSFFEEGDDSKNNGGYNLFEVFVENLYSIYISFVEKGLLSQKAFNIIKKIEYRDFLLNYIIGIFFFKDSTKFSKDGALRILWKNYGLKLYAYYYLAQRICSGVLKRIFKYNDFKNNKNMAAV